MALAGRCHVFLRANGLMLQKKDKSQSATHFSLNGWKFELKTNEQEVEFLNQYAKDLENNVPLFIIEKKTDFFAMHIDFDWVQEDVVTLDYMKQVLKQFGAAFQKFYPKLKRDDKVFQSLVMNSSPVSKMGSDGVTPCMKTGYHVVWPHLVVNKERALRLRSYAITLLRHINGVRNPPMNTFDDAVDECVLRENGFRMMGSYKAKKCKCQSRSNCLECFGARWLAVDRKYVAEAMIDGNGEDMKTQTSSVKNNLKHAVRLSSIRRNSTIPMTSGYVEPVDVVSIHYDDKPFKKRLKQRMQGTDRNLRYTNPAFHDDKKGSSSRKFCTELPMSSLVVSELQDLIRNYHSVYSRIEVKKVRHNKAKTEYRIDTQGFGAHHCMNVDRNHNSNHIFFTIDVAGIYQCCYSRTENHSCSVQCKNFRGKRVGLNGALRIALFEEDTVVAKRKKLEKQLRRTKSTKRRRTQMDIYRLIMQENIEKVKEESALLNDYTGTKEYQHSHQRHPLLRDYTMEDVTKMSFKDLYTRETEEREIQMREGKRLKESLETN